MKFGGIYKEDKINRIGDTVFIKCMVESKIGLIAVIPLPNYLNLTL
jgi:hypothetical protein